jgi:hypothetical protein
VAVALVVVAVAYSGLPLEAAAGFPLDPAAAYLSELAARDRPGRLPFALADGVAGTVAVLAAVVLRRWQRVPRSPLAARAVPGLLAVFGLATVADVLSPMACAPSADAGCARAEQQWDLDAGHEVHLVTSSVATLAAAGLATAVLVLVLGSRRARGRTMPVAALVTGSALLTSVVVAVIAGADTLGLPTPPVGWWQRAQTLAFCATFLCVVPVLRAAGSGAGVGAGADAGVRAVA